MLQLTTVSPLIVGTVGLVEGFPHPNDYSGEAAIPESSAPGAARADRCLDRSFRRRLIERRYLAGAEDNVGLSSVNAAYHCEQAKPPNTLEAGERNRTPLPPTAGQRRTAHASSPLGAWHARQGRIVIPPALTLPGPFVTDRYRAALAAFPVPFHGVRFWQGFLNEHGLAQVELGPPFLDRIVEDLVNYTCDSR